MAPLAECDGMILEAAVMWPLAAITLATCFYLLYSKLTDISLLASYVHLRYVDLSRNNLRDVSALNSLSHLLAVQLDDNKLMTADIPSNLPYLQTANFTGNRVQTLAGITHPVLESLMLNCKNIFDCNSVKSTDLDFGLIFEKLGMCLQCFVPSVL